MKISQQMHKYYPRVLEGKACQISSAASAFILTPNEGYSEILLFREQKSAQIDWVLLRKLLLVSEQEGRCKNLAAVNSALFASVKFCVLLPNLCENCISGRFQIISHAEKVIRAAYLPKLCESLQPNLCLLLIGTQSTLAIQSFARRHKMLAARRRFNCILLLLITIPGGEVR